MDGSPTTGRGRSLTSPSTWLMIGALTPLSKPGSQFSGYRQTGLTVTDMTISS